MPLHLEHLLQPTGGRGEKLGFGAIHDRVVETMENRGTVVLFDFAWAFVPQYWENQLKDMDHFMVVQPKHFDEASRLIQVFCKKGGVDLMVMIHPTVCLPGSGEMPPPTRYQEELQRQHEASLAQAKEEWTWFLMSLKKESLNMVALNSVRHVGEAEERSPVFAPWSTLSDTETFLWREPRTNRAL